MLYGSLYFCQFQVVTWGIPGDHQKERGGVAKEDEGEEWETKKERQKFRMSWVWPFDGVFHSV